MINHYGKRWRFFGKKNLKAGPFEHFRPDAWIMWICKYGKSFEHLCGVFFSIITVTSIGTLTKFKAVSQKLNSFHKAYNLCFLFKVKMKYLKRWNIYFKMSTFTILMEVLLNSTKAESNWKVVVKKQGRLFIWKYQ